MAVRGPLVILVMLLVVLFDLCLAGGAGGSLVDWPLRVYIRYIHPKAAVAGWV
jgi:hypothetical protein